MALDIYRRERGRTEKEIGLEHQEYHYGVPLAQFRDPASIGIAHRR